jgi:uncharacterized protein (TIGR00251 family)
MPSPAHWDAADLILLIHAQPGARRTEPAGLHGDAFKLRLSARSVEGAANAALVEFLAEAFGVPRRQVVIESGKQARHKRVRVCGPERALAERVLGAWSAAGK